jgi:hypothetical protein
MRRTGFKRKIRKPLRRTSWSKIDGTKDGIVKKEKTHDAGWWQKKCDDKMQDINRSLNKRCEVDTNLPCQTGHHFVTKSLSSWLRYKFENLIPISFAKHFEHHTKNDPHVMDVVIQKRGREWVEWIEQNRRNSQKTGIFYYKEIYEWLSKIEKEISEGNLENAIKLMKHDEHKRFVRVGDKMA